MTHLKQYNSVNINSISNEKLGDKMCAMFFSFDDDGFRVTVATRVIPDTVNAFSYCSHARDI